MKPFTKLEAVAVPLARANVDTDQIIPALYLQKPRSDNFGAYLFHDVRHDSRGERRDDFVFNQPPYSTAQIVVAGANFGCGSSREHAVWALCDGGFRAVIAQSFGDIFFGNALKNGLLPVRLPETQVQQLMTELIEAQGARVIVNLHAQSVTFPGGLVVPFDIDPFSRHCLLEGLDEIDYTLAQQDAIEAYERRIGSEQTNQTVKVRIQR